MLFLLNLILAKEVEIKQISDDQGRQRVVGFTCNPLTVSVADNETDARQYLEVLGNPALLTETKGSAEPVVARRFVPDELSSPRRKEPELSTRGVIVHHVKGKGRYRFFIAGKHRAEEVTDTDKNYLLSMYQKVKRLLSESPSALATGQSTSSALVPYMGVPRSISPSLPTGNWQGWHPSTLGLPKGGRDLALVKQPSTAAKEPSPAELKLKIIQLKQRLSDLWNSSLPGIGQ